MVLGSNYYQHQRVTDGFLKKNSIVILIWAFLVSLTFQNLMAVLNIPFIFVFPLIASLLPSCGKVSLDIWLGLDFNLDF